MDAFSFKVTEEDNIVQLAFFGSLKEDSELPELKFYRGKEIYLDLNGMAYINSIGIRIWILWIDQYKDHSFVLTNVPTTVVDQINLVVGFLPPISRMESLYMPFECLSCDEDVKVLFKNEEDFAWKDGEVHLLKDNLTCPTCSKPINLMTSEQRYFRFLKD